MLDGNNYKDWVHPAKMAIRRAKRLGYIKRSIEDPPKRIQYSDWISENMLIMDWLLNSMEESIAANFKYAGIAKEL